MPKKVLDVRRALKKKGFGEDVSRDHMYYTFYYDGKKTSINTKISHGKNEIDDGLLGKMSRQMHLKKADFNEFVSCTLSEEDYIEKMIEAGKLE